MMRASRASLLLGTGLRGLGAGRATTVAGQSTRNSSRPCMDWGLIMAFGLASSYGLAFAQNLSPAQFRATLWCSGFPASTPMASVVFWFLNTGHAPRSHGLADEAVLVRRFTFLHPRDARRSMVVPCPGPAPVGAVVFRQL